MKKMTLGIAAAAMLALGSCGMDPEDSTSTVTYNTVNLVTPVGGGEPSVSEGAYTFYFNLTQGTVSVSTRDLTIDNTKHEFVTDTVACQSGAFIFDGQKGQLIRVANAKGNLDGNKEQPLQNVRFDISSLFKTPTQYVPGYGLKQPPYPVVVAQYQAGDWRVATFQTDAVYFGTTVTKAGNMADYKNEGMLYRVVMDIEKKSADVIIYNAKFAEAAPSLSPIVLKGLSVTWIADGYRIEGKDIVPSVVEGNNLTPNERYMFNNFIFSTSNSALTQCVMKYEVAGRYTGSFAGEYVKEVK